MSPLSTTGSSSAEQPPPDVLLSTAEVATLVGLSPWQVRAQCRTGRLRAVKFGPNGNWLVPMSVVLAAMQPNGDPDDD